MLDTRSFVARTEVCPVCTTFLFRNSESRPQGERDVIINGPEDRTSLPRSSRVRAAIPTKTVSSGDRLHSSVWRRGDMARISSFELAVMR